MRDNNKQGKKNKVKMLRVAMLLTLIFPFSVAMAQTSVSTAGGEAKGDGGTVSYTVGQTAYLGSKTVSVGVQQPYEIFVENTGIENKAISLMQVQAYPNPTTNFLQLNVEKIHEFSQDNTSYLQYNIYDMNGKLLQSNKITEAKTQIDMSSYTPATYFVRVEHGKQELKTFRIIKN